MVPLAERFGWDVDTIMSLTIPQVTRIAEAFESRAQQAPAAEDQTVAVGNPVVIDARKDPEKALAMLGGLGFRKA